MERTENSEILLLFIVLLALPVQGAYVVTPAIDQSSAGQAPYTIQLFIPTRDMIHSDQINDLISGRNGETIIGTSFGLSVYNGTWSTRHRNLNNISEGLMDDYITAVELDAEGSLWIGYSGGILIFNGQYYRPIRDQQLLKETRIKDLQRWNNDMWVATGHAGIHRCRNGTWTWYQPMTRNGPGFYEVRSMALDPNNQILVIATDVEGLHSMQLVGDRPVFHEIAPRSGTWGLLEQVRRDPRGGVYLFNATMIVHYDPLRGPVTVLEDRDLSASPVSINDVAAAPDGRLFIGTDNGMFIWQDSQIVSQLSRFEGMGTSPVVRTVAIDARNRVWFSSTGYVGFYTDQAAMAPPIAIELMTPAHIATPAQETMGPVVTAVPQTPPIAAEIPFFAPDSVFAFLNPVIDPLAKAIRAIGERR
jgi:hypothetical protein